MKLGLLLAGNMAGVVAPTTAVTGVAVTSVSATSVRIVWTVPTTGSEPLSYRILRNGVIVARATGTSFVDTGLTVNTNYTYVVRAYNSAGTAPDSASVVGTPLGFSLKNDLERAASNTLAISANTNGTATNNAFDLFYSNTAATYDTTQFKSGVQSARATHNTGTAGSSMFGWTFTANTLATIYQRMYLYVPGYPPTNTTIVRFGTSTDGAGPSITLSFQGMLGHNGIVMTTAVPLNTWVRVESMTSAAGNELRLFNSPESTTPTQALTNTTASVATGTMRWGVNGQANAGPFFFDDIAISESAWLGPSAAAAPGGTFPWKGLTIRPWKGVGTDTFRGV